MSGRASSCARPGGTRNADASASALTASPTTKTPCSASAIDRPLANRRTMTAPITESPTAPPIVRKNCVNDVAAPRSLRATALCADRSIGTKLSPIPTPPSSASRIATGCVSPGAQRVSSRKATARHVIPASTGAR